MSFYPVFPVDTTAFAHFCFVPINSFTHSNDMSTLTLALCLLITSVASVDFIATETVACFGLRPSVLQDFPPGYSASLLFFSFHLLPSFHLLYPIRLGYKDWR
jgi:hypothetical protein